jgi:hypothetical protein
VRQCAKDVILKELRAARMGREGSGGHIGAGRSAKALKTLGFGENVRGWARS